MGSSGKLALRIMSQSMVACSFRPESSEKLIQTFCWFLCVFCQVTGVLLISESSEKLNSDVSLISKSSEKLTQEFSCFLCDFCQVTGFLLELSSPVELTHQSSVFGQLVQV